MADNLNLLLEERGLEAVHGHAGFDGRLCKHCYRSWPLVMQLSKNLSMLSYVSALIQREIKQKST